MPITPQEIQAEIIEQKPVVDNFVEVTEALVQNAAPEDRNDLNSEVDHVKGTLNDIDEKVTKRQEVLDQAAPLAENYHDALQELSALVVEMEKKLATRRAFGPEPEKITDEIAEIKVCQCAPVAYSPFTAMFLCLSIFLRMQKQKNKQTKN